MAQPKEIEKILPARPGDYPSVQNWVEQFTMNGLVIRWSPAALFKIGLIAEGTIAILWAGAFLVFGTGLPAWAHAGFAALACLPPALIIRRYVRESPDPVRLDLDVHGRRLDLPNARKHFALDQSRVRFIHDYFREPGTAFNKSEFNVEVTPLAGGPPELLRVLAFRGYREEFDQLGDRLRRLGFPFHIRKHEL